MYKAVTEFRDLQDMHLYQKDDIFPYDGREIPADRIAALLNGQTRQISRLSPWLRNLSLKNRNRADGP